ncbi:hypothetical protein SGLAM104S_01127 [Streptomyces glaucescens]
MSARPSSSYISMTRPTRVTWVYQSSSARTVRVTRGSRRRCFRRTRPASRLIRTRWSPSQRYQVAVETGAPSERTVAITQGLARRSSSWASGGSGGLDISGSFPGRGSGYGYLDVSRRLLPTRP